MEYFHASRHEYFTGRTSLLSDSSVSTNTFRYTNIKPHIYLRTDDNTDMSERIKWAEEDELQYWYNKLLALVQNSNAVSKANRIKKLFQSYEAHSNEIISKKTTPNPERSEYAGNCYVFNMIYEDSIEENVDGNTHQTPQSKLDNRKKSPESDLEFIRKSSSGSGDKITPTDRRFTFDPTSIRRGTRRISRVPGIHDPTFSFRDTSSFPSIPREFTRDTIDPVRFTFGTE